MIEYHNFPHVTISILHWNDEEATACCLDSVLFDSYPFRQIIVIDNGSDVPLTQKFKTKYPEVIFRRSESNLGFAGGHNLILRDMNVFGNSAFIWVLNNDAIVTKGCLQTLVEKTMLYGGVGLASPSICYLHDQDRIEFLAASIDFEQFTTERLRDQALISELLKQSPQRLWLAGTALLISRQVIEAGICFDDRFFAYFEDNDLSIRVSQQGLKILPVPGAKILHRAPEDNTNRAEHYHYLMSRNAWLFWSKHCHKPHRRFPLLCEYLARTVIAASELMPVSKEKSSAVLRGAYDAFLGRTGPPRFGKAYKNWLLTAFLIAPYKKAAVLRAIAKVFNVYRRTFEISK